MPSPPAPRTSDRTSSPAHSTRSPTELDPSLVDERRQAENPLFWDQRLQKWTSREPEESERPANDSKRSSGSVTQVDGLDGTGEKETHDLAGSGDEQEIIWVTWDGKDDPENPFNWPKYRKWIVSLLISMFTFVTAYTAGSYAIALPSLRRELDVSQEVAIIGLSIYALGFAIAPLFLAPFSEVFGRLPMYQATFGLHLLLYIPVATAQNITAVIVTRFIQGACGSSGSTMVGGTLADIWDVHERGLPMSLFSAAAFLATGLGPVTMGYVEQYYGWRWTIWIQMIFAGILGVGYALFLRETRGSVILSKRAARLRKQTGSDKYRCKADEERASLSVLFRVSLMRPIHLLFTEPVVAAFSAWVGFAWGIMYGLLEAVPIMVQEVYGFDNGQTGLAFFAMAIGGGIGAATNPLQEALYRRGVRRRGPEARLYFAMIGGVGMPIGGLIFAFAQGRGPWIGPLIGIGVVMWSIFHIYVAGFNYLADSYTLYASSAIAGQSFTRNLMGAIFPLFTAQAYHGLSITWATFMFSMIGAVLGLVPFVLFFYGNQLRARSKFAQALLAAQLAEEEANSATSTRTGNKKLEAGGEEKAQGEAR